MPHHCFLIFVSQISSFYRSLQKTANIWATFELPRGAQAFSRANKAKQMKCFSSKQEFLENSHVKHKYQFKVAHAIKISEAWCTYSSKK